MEKKSLKVGDKFYVGDNGIVEIVDLWSISPNYVMVKGKDRDTPYLLHVNLINPYYKFVDIPSGGLTLKQAYKNRLESINNRLFGVIQHLLNEKELDAKTIRALENASDIISFVLDPKAKNLETVPETAKKGGDSK